MGFPSAELMKEAAMSDFRDEFGRDRMYDPNVRGNTSPGGLVAAAVIVVAVVGLLVAFGHPANHGNNNQMANNTPPPMTHMAPLAGSPVHQ
jgi:hypothetical protein